MVSKVLILDQWLAGYNQYRFVGIGTNCIGFIWIYTPSDAQLSSLLYGLINVLDYVC